MNDKHSDGEENFISGMWRVSQNSRRQLEASSAAQEYPKHVEYEMIVRRVYERADEQDYAMAKQGISLFRTNVFSFNLQQ